MDVEHRLSAPAGTTVTITTAKISIDINNRPLPNTAQLQEYFGASLLFTCGNDLQLLPEQGGVWSERMPNLTDWRSQTTQQEFAGFDYADCAQEFVRRSPDYRRDYEQVKTRIAAGGLNERHEWEVLARRWGMIFPLRPRREGQRRTRNLGTIRVADDCNS